MTKYAYSGRSDQLLASKRRLADARRLYAAGGWAGAMYLAGYAIECKLKFKLMERYGVRNLEALETLLSDRTNRQTTMRTHSLDFLFSHFKVHGNREVRSARSLVNRWSVDWRYRPDEGDKNECEGFLSAVSELSQYIDRSLY